MGNPAVPAPVGSGGLSLEVEGGSSPRAGSWRLVARRLRAHRLAMIGVVILAVVIVATVIGARLWRYGYAEITDDISSPPSWRHPMGTDGIGRDLLAQVLRGTQKSLQVGVVVAIASTALGTVVGCLAGYFRGWLDAMLMRFTDVVIAVPGIAVLAVLAGSVQAQAGNWFAIALILAALSWTGLARVVRSVVLSLRELEQDPALALPVWIDDVPAHPPRGGRRFVGRRQERGVLAAALQAAREGRGSFVLVTGEAGIGKTRLAEEVASEARFTGMQVAWGSVWEDRGAPPFWPWVQVVRAFIDEAPPHARADGWPSDLRSLLRPSEDPATGLNAAGADGSAARLALFDATTELLRKAASETPLLVVLDDLHAADISSLLLLEFLSSRLTDAAVLLVATSRDVEARLVPGVAEVLGAAARHGSRLSLRGLAEDEVGHLMSAVAGVIPSVEAVAHLHRATEGSPFLVDELVRLLARRVFRSPGTATACTSTRFRTVCARWSAAVLAAYRRMQGTPWEWPPPSGVISVWTSCTQHQADRQLNCSSCWRKL